MENKMNEKILTCLDKYFASASQVITTIEHNQKQPKWYVAFAGKQGTGKSLLLNALMKEMLLPSEAGETTCIPIEVHYSTQPCILAFFRDGSQRELYTAADIQQLADNDYNPGNEQEVQKIIVYRTLDFLQSGLVLVDMPGDGSLTDENKETYRNYMKQVSSVIFVCSGQITRSEAEDLYAVWRLMAQIGFVQNRFTQETDEEIADVVSYNKGNLESKAKGENLSFTNKIMVVNAFQACQAQLNNRQEELIRSNLGELQDYLRHRAGTWKEQALKSGNQKIQDIVQISIETIEHQKVNYITQKNELEEKINEKQKLYEKEQKILKQKQENISKQLKKISRKLKPRIAGLVGIFEKNVKNDIEQDIQQNTTRGEGLNTSFQMYCRHREKEIRKEFSTEFQKQIIPVQEEMENVRQILEQSTTVSLKTVRGILRREEFHWEKVFKILPVVFAGGGAAAGGVAGGAIGAYFSGGAGTATGAKVGASVGKWVGGTIGAILGKPVEKYIVKPIKKSRREKASEDADNAIEKVGRKVEKNLYEMLEMLVDSINKSVKEQINQQFWLQQEGCQVYL